MQLSFSIVILLIAVYTIEGVSIGNCKGANSCKLEDLGCYNDHVNRALPEEILNERDASSKVYGGQSVDWEHFDTWLSGFACRCANIAASKGYEIIGLQFYGECWSGLNAHLTYDKYGKSDKCISKDMKLTSESSDHSQCGYHIGPSWTNYVYRIGVNGCLKHNIEPIGCFHDDMVSPRPMPHYLINERDETHEGWNGHTIQWPQWITYSPEMICRCADAASKRGDDYFAMQMYGECWSGKSNEVHYNRNGGSTECYNEYLDEKCRCNSYNCVGAAHTNYVYRLHSNVTCTSIKH